MKLSTCLFLLFQFLAQQSFAQRAIRGIVYDGDNKEPLIGASVMLKGTNVATITGTDGRFSLNGDTNAKTLLISFAGYSEQEVPIANSNEVTITLRPKANLEEVVVTSLGVEAKRSNLSYSTQRVSAKDFNTSRIGDISQQLSGMVPGLNINTGNGSGVSSSRIVLRGEASLNLNKNQPLIVVDGVVVSNNLDGVGGASESGNNLPVDYGNGLTDFNTDDIEDVSVLKGSKAAALYGTRAANGALVIRTRSGANKKGLGIEYNTGVTIDRVTSFWDEQTDYGGGFDNAFRVDWGGNYGAPTDGALIKQPTGAQSSTGISVEPTPFLKRLDRKGFFQTGVGTNNNLALSFNNNKTWGRVSMSHLSRTGIVPNTEYKRKNVGFRLGTDVTDRLKLDISANYINSSSDNLPVIGGGGEGIINNMYWGMNNYDYNDYKKDIWLPGKEGVTQNYFLSWGTNPWLIVRKNLNGFKRKRLFGNIKATYKLTENLSAFVRTGTDFYDDRRQSQRPSGQPNFPNGMYREQSIGFQETNTDFLLSYDKKMKGDISLNLNAGANRLDQTYNTDFYESRKLGVPFVYNKGNAGDVPRTINYDATKRINSVYGSAQVGLDEKLFVDVTGRNDWSSALPMNDNSFFYPSVGVSAILSRLLNLPQMISYAQLRASWAATGNDTDPLLTQRVLSFGTLPSSVINPSNLVNPALKPEKTKAIEVGGEFKFLNNRFGVDVNYYNNVTTDQILQVPISQASGAVTRLINAGKIKNSGIEIFAKATPVRTKSFGWDVTLAWARNRGKVVELIDGVESFVIAQGPSGGTVEARPGGRMGDIYGRGLARTSQGDLILDVVNVSGTSLVRPRLDNRIKRLGNYNPDWTAGFTNSFNYKNLTLRFLLDYRSGGLLSVADGALLYRSGIVTETLPYRTSKFVPDGVVAGTGGSFSKNSIPTTGQDWYRSYYPSANVESNSYDATYLKLREVSIGADLKPWLKMLPVESLRFSAFGRNLFTKTKSSFLRHFDPESLALSGSSLIPGFIVGQLPSPQTYGFNLSVGF
ncbi:MAG: SusC/RagA family TonB-linked outer membrane protein [Chitinophagaceae bacterium]